MSRTLQVPKLGIYPMLPALPLELPFIPGKIFHVRPANGNDSWSGRQPHTAFKTLAAALAKATEDRNDIVLLYSESNSAGGTTDYLTETLDWNKALVHLIGVNAGGPFSQRSRIAWKSTAASESNVPLFTLSASGCLIQNVSFVVGSADANLSFGVNVTGDRNHLRKVSIAFPVNDANDAAGAYALKIDGATDCLFDACDIGSYTTDLGSAANQLLLVDGGCSMTKFVDCEFIARLQSDTNSPFVRLADAGAVGFGCLWFKRCNFIATSVNGANTQSGAFKTAAAQTDGRIVLADCHTNAGKWDVDDRDMILNGCVGVPIDDNAGEMLAV